MFGDDDNTQGDQAQAGPPAVTPAYPAADASSAGDAATTPAAALPAVPDSSSYDNPPSAPHTQDDALGALVAEDAPEPAVAAPVAEEAPHEPELSDTPVPADPKEELMSIKQQALQQLSPLVGHLEQTAEEKFKTMMMLIQASDNKDLIADAYKAAGEIEDEKVRAQALLDIVNEINYFTQQPEA